MKARAVALIAIGVLAVALGAAQFVSEDGLVGETMLLISGEDTAYAAGYTWAGFRSLRIGDSEERVRTVLGEPLEIVEVSGRRVFVYSRSPRSTHFRLRVVRVYNGKVEGLISEAHVD